MTVVDHVSERDRLIMAAAWFRRRAFTHRRQGTDEGMSVCVCVTVCLSVWY